MDLNDEHLNPLYILPVLENVLKYAEIESIPRLKELRNINSIWSICAGNALKNANSKISNFATLANEDKIQEFIHLFKNGTILHDCFTFQPNVRICLHNTIFMNFMTQFGNRIRVLVLKGYSIKEKNLQSFEPTHFLNLEPKTFRRLILRIPNLESLQFDDAALENQLFTPADNLRKLEKLAIGCIPIKMTIGRELMMYAKNLKEITITFLTNEHKSSKFGLFTTLTTMAELKMKFEKLTIETINCNYLDDFPTNDTWGFYDFSTIKFNKLQIKIKCYSMRNTIQLYIFMSNHSSLNSIEEFTEEIESIKTSSTGNYDYMQPFLFKNLKTLTLKFPPTFIATGQIGCYLNLPHLENLTIMNCIMEIPFNYSSKCSAMKNFSLINIVGVRLIPNARYDRFFSTHLGNLKSFIFRINSFHELANEYNGRITENELCIMIIHKHFSWATKEFPEQILKFSYPVLKPSYEWLFNLELSQFK